MLRINDLKEKLENLAQDYEAPMPQDVSGYTVDEWLKYEVMPRLEADLAQALEAHATHQDFLMESPSDREDYAMDAELMIAERILEEALYS